VKFEHIIKDLKNKVYHPIYLLCGEEEYFIDILSDYIEEHVLDEAEKEFNQTVLYGLETSVPELIAAAKRFPMMASYQVIIVKEAQSLSKLADLAEYAKNPQKTTILVLNHKHKKADGRSEFVKLMKKQGVYFESKPLYENEIPAWINHQLKNKGFEITPKACQLMVENIGVELSKISNELNKLVITLGNPKTIDEHDIERNIGISKDYNVFELTKALGNRDLVKANKIVNHFGKNSKDHPLPATLPMLYSFFSKVLLYHTLKSTDNRTVASTLGINPYFAGDYAVAARNYSVKKIARIMSALRSADLRSKGVGSTDASQADLYKELIFDILH
jgi:DNA polymerase-3 subunit delta